MFKLLILMIPTFLFAWAGGGLFQQFPNRYFIETGAWLGDGIEQAIKAGFSEIHSIEISEYNYAICKEKFASRSNVHIWRGDSTTVLDQVLAQIYEPVTFWLDAHKCAVDSGRGETNTPILKELEAIQRHAIKTHTILIDDVRYFGTEEFDNVPLSEVIKRIKEINSKYTITYAPGYQANDILIAQISQ